MLELFLFRFCVSPSIFDLFDSPASNKTYLLDTGFTGSNHPPLQDVIVWDGSAWAICRVKGPTPNVAADLNPKQGVLQKRVCYFWWV